MLLQTMMIMSGSWEIIKFRILLTQNLFSGIMTRISVIPLTKVMPSGKTGTGSLLRIRILKRRSGINLTGEKSSDYPDPSGGKSKPGQEKFQQAERAQFPVKVSGRKRNRLP